VKFAFIAVIAVIACARSASAQTLDCKIVPGDENSNTGGVDATATISPADYQAGYRATGGGCLQHPSATGEHYTFTSKLIPAANAFTCGVIGSSAEGYRITPYVVACRVSPRKADAANQFSSEGLGGGIVTIARLTGDWPNYTNQIPYSYRICNTKGGQTIGVYVGVQDSQASGNYHEIPFGACLEIDQPKQISFHTPYTVSVDVAGVYQIFKPGTFKTTQVVALNLTKTTPDQQITLAPGNTETASCTRTTTPNAPNWGSCKMTSLTGGKNFRVCFDGGYSNQPAGADEYPGSLIPMVLDESLIGQSPGATPNEFIYNSIAPSGCRDVFNVTQAYIVITGQNNWNNQSVSQVTYRYREISP
jgi:hypothetical protein